MFEGILFTLIPFASIHYEAVYYGRGILKYELREKKSSLLFQTPSEQFKCSWEENWISPISGHDVDHLNLENFTQNPKYWSKWLTDDKSDGKSYGFNKRCHTYHLEKVSSSFVQKVKNPFYRTI